MEAVEDFDGSVFDPPLDERPRALRQPLRMAVRIIYSIKRFSPSIHPSSVRPRRKPSM